MLLNIFLQENFIYNSFVYDVSLESLVRMQYELSKKGISLIESAMIPIFELDAYSGLVYKDIKEEAEHPKF